MANDDYPRLCGGTFFALILQALKQRAKARQHFQGDRDGLSEPDVLVGLIKVINPDYREPREGTLRVKTNDFKSCKISEGMYLPFGDAEQVDAFDLRVRRAYQVALNGMTMFTEQFLEHSINVQKDVKLVKALIDLIQQDASIDADEEFYIEEHGKPIKKADFSDLDDVCFPAFLLGVWHYVVVYRKDNTIGRNTYDLWCPGNGGAQRKYIGDMGKRITKDIRARWVVDDTADDSSDDTADGAHSDLDGAEASDPEADILVGEADDYDAGTNKDESTGEHKNQAQSNPVAVIQNAKVIQNGDKSISLINDGIITINL